MCFTLEDVKKVEEEQNQPNISADTVSNSLNLSKDVDLSASVDIDTKSSLASAESSGPGSPATDSPVLVNDYVSSFFFLTYLNV